MERFVIYFDSLIVLFILFVKVLTFIPFNGWGRTPFAVIDADEMDFVIFVFTVAGFTGSLNLDLIIFFGGCTGNFPFCTPAAKDV